MDRALLAMADPGPVVVVPLASTPGADYARTGAHALAYFAALGADAVLAPDARKDAAGAASAVDGAGYIVLTGGSPRTLRDALVETGLGEHIRGAADRGVLVMGSSAGAMVACRTTLLPQWRGNPNVGPGLGLLDGYVVVPHFDGRRTAWVRAGLAAEPAVLGIPENSGVLVEDGRLTSLGQAPVTLITAEGRQDVAGVGFEPT
ncbi:MAG: Type 1 glutamine amidotransferase-like domain-containing protein [Frankiaceae bacterium]|nr:Type 1 glutamine amidotransferase-like domain-containing protein [Frankiaceae bacterium]